MLNRLRCSGEELIKCFRKYSFKNQKAIEMSYDFRADIFEKKKVVDFFCD